MKNFKILFFTTMTLMLFVACETDPDIVADVADEAGMIINVTATSTSSILGSPEAGVDLEDAEVTITNASLDMTVSISSGNMNNIEKIEIVKSFNGGAEISLAESTSLPYNLVIDNLDDLLSGTGVVESDLRIGDVLSFRTKVYQTDGNVYYYNSSIGDYAMVVNCSSLLAGTYTVSYTSGDYIYTVTEISPGLYESDQMLGWPTSGYWVRFTDTCGVLSFDINDWLFTSSNPVSGNGFVDSDGNLVWSDVAVSGVPGLGTTWTMYRN